MRRALSEKKAVVICTDYVARRKYRLSHDLLISDDTFSFVLKTKSRLIFNAARVTPEGILETHFALPEMEENIGANDLAIQFKLFAEKVFGTKQRWTILAQRPAHSAKVDQKAR